MSHWVERASGVETEVTQGVPPDPRIPVRRNSSTSFTIISTESGFDNVGRDGQDK